MVPTYFNYRSLVSWFMCKLWIKICYLPHRANILPQLKVWSWRSTFSGSRRHTGETKGTKTFSLSVDKTQIKLPRAAGHESSNPRCSFSYKATRMFSNAVRLFLCGLFTVFSSKKTTRREEGTHSHALPVTQKMTALPLDTRMARFACGEWSNNATLTPVHSHPVFVSFMLISAPVKLYVVRLLKTLLFILSGETSTKRRSTHTPPCTGTTVLSAHCASPQKVDAFHTKILHLSLVFCHKTHFKLDGNKIKLTKFTWSGKNKPLNHRIRCRSVWGECAKSIY